MEDRLEIWLELLAGKLDRLIELGENVERASRSQGMPEEWGEHEEDHFADANKMVAEGPSTEAVRSDSLGDGYRIPSEGDIGKVVEVRHAMGELWVQRKLVKVLSDSVPGCAALRHCQFLCSLDQSQTMATCWRWARIKIDEPAKDKPAEEPPKKWRRLTDEFVQPGDWANAKVNRQDVDPPDEGWIPADPCYFGKRACTLSMYFARPVAEEPAKEPEHPAGPKPDPGEGCCEPTEKGIGGDIEVIATASWIHGKRSPAEPPAKEEPAEPEYREPVLPGDAGKECEVSDNGLDWRKARLAGYKKASNPWSYSTIVGEYVCRHARIKKDA